MFCGLHHILAIVPVKAVCSAKEINEKERI